MEELLKKISGFIAEGEEEEAVNAVREALKTGIEPMVILNEGAARGMDIVSQQYTNGEAFLPELVLAGDAMSQVLGIIFAEMNSEQIAKSKVGTVVIGQAKGDVHDIGKNVVAALLAVNGFEVHDLGIDVPVKEFLEKAKAVNADIIGMSTLLTTSLPYLDDLKRYIQDTGNGDKFRYIVGGGPVTPEFATKIGANGWARNAFDCVELCKKLMAISNFANSEIVLVDSEAN